LTEKTAAGLLSLITTAIFITPFCGLLFGCGCTWPWAGLADYCNLYAHHPILICPWCKPLPIGITALGITVYMTYLVATARYPASLSDHAYASYATNLAIRIILAGFTFLGLALITAWTAAAVQPHLLNASVLTTPLFNKLR